MFRRVHKYVIEIGSEVFGDTPVVMPVGARIVHAGQDPSGRDCVWAEVDPNEERTETRKILKAATGHIEIPPHAVHIASSVSGGFVWHYYDCTMFGPHGSIIG